MKGYLYMNTSLSCAIVLLQKLQYLRKSPRPPDLLARAGDFWITFCLDFSLVPSSTDGLRHLGGFLSLEEGATIPTSLADSTVKDIWLRRSFSMKFDDSPSLDRFTDIALSKFDNYQLRLRMDLRKEIDI